MKLDDLFERVDTTMRGLPTTRYIDLFFGGCVGIAQSLEARGFTPTTIGRKFIPLFSTQEQAERFAKKNNCDSIVRVKKIPANYLQIDYRLENAPSDIWEAIKMVNRGEKLVLKLNRELPPANFEFINKLKKQHKK